MTKLPEIPASAPFNLEQRAWLSGFLVGLFSAATKENHLSSPTAATVDLLVLYGSQTGTAEGLAKRCAKEAVKRGCQARVIDMNRFESIAWDKETHVLIITSTWGDGDPPDNAVGFWNFLNSPSPPHLKHLNFGVIALGDRNYVNFCGAGKKFDSRFEQLGARRLSACAECDVDYEQTTQAWMDQWWQQLAGVASPSGSTRGQAPIFEVQPPQPTRLVEVPPGSRANPYSSRLVGNRVLNGDGSSKETRHFELDLPSTLVSYEVGDALGVWPTNDSTLVDRILIALQCDGEEAVDHPDAQGLPLRKALLEKFSVTQASSAFLEALAEKQQDSSLARLMKSGNTSELQNFLVGRDVLDLLTGCPKVPLSPNEFVGLLRKLTPRLYSISSSPKAHGDVVHLTVSIVRYEAHGRPRHGVCSTFLSDRTEEGTCVPVFVQKSAHFRLPEDPATPAIMVGPGTGVAPFRAFLAERAAAGAPGGNWLFFGDQRESTDFLYREELEAFQRNNVLTRLDTAFSRDQSEKIYVQTRMLQNASALYEWLEQGAHFYVCGDARRMARDVDAALHQVVQQGRGKGEEDAAAYIEDLKKGKRYQRDVY